MKRLLLISTLLWLTTFAIGQTFAPTGAKWYYSAQANGAAPPNSEYYLYESQLDTVVGGHSCKKISVTYYKYQNGDTAYLPPVFTYQSTDTVFYYNTIYSRYFPLYIFNVVQGDTLVFHSPTVPFNPADTLWQSVVDSVTSFIVGADTLQRVWTTEPNTNAFSWWGGYIELLGCPFLMLPQPHTIFPEWDGPMRCYSDSIISYNFNTFLCDYRLTTGVNEIENSFGLSIFPNPTDNQINIKTTDSRQFSFKIYNSFGQLIKTGILHQTTSLSIDNFSSGLYSIEFTADNKVLRQCFIVDK
ncbi:MAG: T9SS type A sorting domain-containing protein [Bacteroidetes bacterium]|nr:T9SS type A sorting domain-containing protein [Bacteroidota bacterium]